MNSSEFVDEETCTFGRTIVRICNTLPSIGLIYVTICSCHLQLFGWPLDPLLSRWWPIRASNIIFVFIKGKRKRQNEKQRTQSKNDSNRALRHALYYERCSALSKTTDFASSKPAMRRASCNDSCCCFSRLRAPRGLERRALDIPAPFPVGLSGKASARPPCLCRAGSSRLNPRPLQEHVPDALPIARRT